MNNAKSKYTYYKSIHIAFIKEVRERKTKKTLYIRN